MKAKKKKIIRFKITGLILLAIFSFLVLCGGFFWSLRQGTRWLIKLGENEFQQLNQKILNEQQAELSQVRQILNETETSLNELEKQLSEIEETDQYGRPVKKFKVRAFTDKEKQRLLEQADQLSHLAFDLNKKYIDYQNDYSIQFNPFRDFKVDEGIGYMVYLSVSVDQLARKTEQIAFGGQVDAEQLKIVKKQLEQTRWRLEGKKERLN